MKKLLAVMVVAIMVFACAMTGSAAITNEEKALIDLLSKKITMASGTVVSLPDKYINQAEDYLTKAELTPQQIADVTVYVKAAQKLVEDSNAKRFDEADSDVKLGVIEEAEKAAEVINAKLVVDKLDKPIVDDGVTANYKVSLEFTSESTVPGYTEGSKIDITVNEITQTGAEGDITVAVIGGVAVLAAAVFVVIASRKRATSK